MIKPDEVAELKRVGACADLLGHFFSADGRVLDIDLSARATSMSPADLKKHRIVAIAGGQPKVDGAARACCAAACLHGLITDEVTASALARDKPEDTSGATSKNAENGSKCNQREMKCMFDQRKESRSTPTPTNESAGAICSTVPPSSELPASQPMPSSHPRSRGRWPRISTGRRQSGKTIKLLLNKHPYADAMIADIDAFKYADRHERHLRHFSGGRLFRQGDGGACRRSRPI